VNPKYIARSATPGFWNVTWMPNDLSTTLVDDLRDVAREDRLA
jgi:hypothetical protein